MFESAFGRHRHWLRPGRRRKKTAGCHLVVYYSLNVIPNLVKKAAWPGPCRTGSYVNRATIYFLRMGGVLCLKGIFPTIGVLRYLCEVPTQREWLKAAWIWIKEIGQGERGDLDLFNQRLLITSSAPNKILRSWNIGLGCNYKIFIPRREMRRAYPEWVQLRLFPFIEFWVRKGILHFKIA